VASYLETVRLSKKYDGLVALDHVGLKSSVGQITSIVGVNGSGKTTLLKILAGLEEANDGVIMVDSKNVSSESLRARSTMVFQKSVIISGTVYDNVAYGLRVNGVPSKDIKDRVQHALSTVNLAEFGRRKARKLSSGEQQRVAIARALVIEREIILIDEPTSNLDPANTLIIEQAIKDSAQSRILILSTHNLPQAKRLSHRLIHLYRGHLVEDGTTEEFFARPRDEKTRLFIGGDLQ
jgi:tungstate transport system ATP-binding protein